VAEVYERLIRERGPQRVLRMALRGLEFGPAEGDYQVVYIHSDRGVIECQYYAAEGSQLAAVFVGGVGGGFDTPARGLYPRLCRVLREEGIASLRVRYRQPTFLEEGVLDVLAGLTFLEYEGIQRSALVGHSFGGAVVIQAGVAGGTTKTVVTLATQSYGAGVVERLPGGCSILLLHGEDDDVLPPVCSEGIHDLAHKPRELRLYRGAGHALDEVAEEVYQVVHAWIVEHLKESMP